MSYKLHKDIALKKIRSKSCSAAELNLGHVPPEVNTEIKTKQEGGSECLGRREVKKRQE